MAFADNLATLPATDHLAGIELTGPDGRQARIDNAPGSQGSVRIYQHLALQYGAIDRAAAQAGLALYAEHAEDARRHPGKHPNIDRLLGVVARGGGYAVRLIQKG